MNKYYRDRKGVIVKAEKPLGYKIILLTAATVVWFAVAVGMWLQG